MLRSAHVYIRVTDRGYSGVAYGMIITVPPQWATSSEETRVACIVNVPYDKGTNSERGADEQARCLHTISGVSMNVPSNGVYQTPVELSSGEIVRKQKFR